MKRTSLLTAIFALASIGPTLSAQQQEETGVQKEVMVFSSQEQADPTEAPLIITATRELGPDGEENFEVFSVAPTVNISSLPGGLTASPDHLINHAGVRKELELVDEQIDQLRAIQDEAKQNMRQYMEDMKQGGRLDPERIAAMREAMQQFRDKKQQRIREILLPHQLERLNQISVQTRIRNQGESKALMSKRIADELGIDDEQKERLKRRSEEIKAHLQEKIARLKEEARQELLQELTPEQRTRFEAMKGESFQPEVARTPGPVQLPPIRPRR